MMKKSNWSQLPSRLASWFDEAHEQLGWLVAVTGLALTTLSVVALLRGEHVPWQLVACLVALVALGCVTLLGTQRYRGLTIGRDGVSFKGDVGKVEMNGVVDSAEEKEE